MLSLRYDPAPLMAVEIDEEERIYISDLSGIVNREVNTIRKWERLGLLPKKLHPRRGKRGWRYWTHEQVHGPGGILEWMQTNDMRPGRYLTAAEDADKHVAALRRPKYLSNRLIKSVRTMTRNRTPLEEILDEIYPHTRYASKQRLEIALRHYFNRQGWVFPPYEDNTRHGL